MNLLVFPLPLFQRLLLAIAERPLSAAFVRVGFHRARSHRVWLARDFNLAPPDAPAPPQGPLFRIALAATQFPHFPISQFPSSVVGHISLGQGEQRGQIWGFVRVDDIFEPLDCLSLVGAGMHTLTLNDQCPMTNSQSLDIPLERWSRTIGALGGEDVWQRLVSLHPCIIGCGRTGSLVATSLARLGVRELTLIDPDLVEEHNLGEMDAVTSADIGRSKVEAIACHLRVQFPNFPVSQFPTSVTAESALAACKDADVLFCCADNDAARLASALIATLYHKVLLDVGTGVFYDDPSPTHPHAHTPIPRQLGADVRLILPADGCLLCVGNLSHYQQAVEDICNFRSSLALHSDWRRQRAGSLRTLNQIAAHIGVQMLQDLVAERIQSSLWARVEFDDDGRMSVHYPPTHQPTSAPCPLCAKAGLGDENLWIEGGTS